MSILCVITGMSTMAGNALLMKGLMSLRQKLSIGEIDDRQFSSSLKTSDFGNILHWNKPNPFTQNYAQFTDNVNNTKFLPKRFGMKTSSPYVYKIVNSLLRLTRRAI